MKKAERTRSVIEKYGYYQEYIRLLAKKDIRETPKVTDLALSSGAIQRAYKEMKKERFPGTIIHYLSLVGGLFELELLIKDGSILDRNRMIDYLMNHIESASVLVRAIEYIRVVDLDELRKRFKDRPDLWESVYQSLTMVKQLSLGVEIRAPWSDQPELNPLIMRILEYQGVAPDVVTSSTSSQSTNQSKTPSDQETKAARRGPRPKTPGHQPQ